MSNFHRKSRTRDSIQHSSYGSNETHIGLIMHNLKAWNWNQLKFWKYFLFVSSNSCHKKMLLESLTIPLNKCGNYKIHMYVEKLSTLNHRQMTGEKVFRPCYNFWTIVKTNHSTDFSCKSKNPWIHEKFYWVAIWILALCPEFVPDQIWPSPLSGRLVVQSQYTKRLHRQVTKIQEDTNFVYF